MLISYSLLCDGPMLRVSEVLVTFVMLVDFGVSRLAVKPRAFSILLGTLPSAKPCAEVRSLLCGGPVLSLQPSLGFKTKGVIKKRCRDCYMVKRRGRWFVLCKTNPKHKQRQM